MTHKSKITPFHFTFIAFLIRQYIRICLTGQFFHGYFSDFLLFLSPTNNVDFCPVFYKLCDSQSHSKPVLVTFIYRRLRNTLILTYFTYSPL